MRHPDWRQHQDRLTGTLWLLPAVFTAGAIMFGAAVSHVRPSRDSVFGPLLFVGTPDEARRLLLTCATSIVGVLALIIGLTMVALQTAANRYSPRLLRNFVRNRTTQFVLAVFVGSFTYNAAGLYTVGLEPGELPRLAVTLGLCSLFLCMGALIFYIDRMVRSIQIDQVLAKIELTTARTIADTPPGVGRTAGDAEAVVTAGPPVGAAVIHANKSGYIEYVQTASIVAVATRCRCTVLLSVGVGAHVVANTPLAWVWPANTNVSELRAALGEAVHIGFERSHRQDVAFGFAQLVDIAALAMHNFDYHTAVQSTNELAILMCKLANVPLGAEIYRDGAGTDRLIAPAPGFDDYLDLACGQILRRGAAEPVVLQALLDMLRDIGSVVAIDQRRSAVVRKVHEVLITGQRRLQDPIEVAKLEAVADDTKRRVAAIDHSQVEITEHR